MLLIEAGSDTVGNTCYVGVFHALNDKVIYRKLRAELDEAWPDKTQPFPLQALENLPYLVHIQLHLLSVTDVGTKTAFIKESLRMSNGVVTPLPRVVQQRMRISGYTVPAGVGLVSCCPDSPIYETALGRSTSPWPLASFTTTQRSSRTRNISIPIAG